MAVPFNLPSDEYTLEQYRRIHRLLLDLMELLRSFTGVGFIASQQNINQNADEIVAEPAPVQENVIPAPITLPDVVSGTLNTSPTFQNVNYTIESVNNDSCYESHNSSPYRRPSIERNDISRRRAVSCTNRTRRRSIRSRIKLHTRRRGSENFNTVRKMEIEEKENVPDICSCPGDSPQCISVSESQTSGQIYTTVSSCKYRPQQDESAEKVKSYENDETNTVKVPSWVIIGEELRNIANCFNGSKEDDKRSTKISHLKASSLFSLLLPNQIGKTMLATMLIVIGWKLLKQT